MKSIKELYRIGTGPSSSHTMGPRKAAEIFLERHPEAASFKVTLYGSLAATGKGHMTNIAITEVLQPIAPVEIIWEPKIFLPFHPNGMKFVSVDKAGKETDRWTVFSIGGGALAEENDGASSVNTPDVYSMSSMTEIMQWCERTGKSYWEYVKECEDSDLWDYLQEVWKTMQDAVKRGLEQEGVLPGPLNLRRKASTYYIRASGYKQSLQSRGLVFAYALAVSEENASGGVIVTAPTCGSCGVMPAVLYHLSKSRDFSDTRILRALATAGLVGNIVKTNASISGAEVGCQGEVGVACAMALAAGQPTFWRQPCTNRICCGNGFGTSSGNDLRPGMRTGADSLYRTECLCRRTRLGCQPLLLFHRWYAPGIFRQSSSSYERNRERPSVALQGNK